MGAFSMSLRQVVCAGVILASLATGSLAIVRRDDTSDSFYRRLGNRNVFASVGRVEIDYGRGYEAIASATLYGPDRVVSAGHVFDDRSLEGAQGVRINFGRGRVAYIDFAAPGVVNIHPNYEASRLINDLCVVFLPPTFRVDPARLYTGRRIRNDTDVTFIGYGDTGTGLKGSNVFSTKKRGGQNTLGTYYMGGRSFEVDFDRPGYERYSSLGGRQPVRLEGLLGPGDSGGSVWVQRGGKWRLIGINSYGLDWYPRGRGNGTMDDYGDHSGFVYLPSYKTWLDSLVNPNP
jgi:Trypsin